MKSARLAQRFALWDFRGYNSITTEAVPAPGDLQSEMRWYWEAGHFKKVRLGKESEDVENTAVWRRGK